MHAAFVASLVGAARAVPTLVVPACRAGVARATNFSVSPEAADVPARQSTAATICHTKVGLHVSMVARDRNVFSGVTQCNSRSLWSHGDLLEFYIGPVASLHDAPVWYHEIDSVPTGATYVGHQNNTLGNYTVPRACPGCVASKCSPLHPGELCENWLPCHGRASFDGHPELRVRVSNGTEQWASRLTVPWTLFPEGSRHGHALWRANFYRYDYPDGPEGKYELSAWSPTHAPGFHEPHRFGALVMDFSE